MRKLAVLSAACLVASAGVACNRNADADRPPATVSPPETQPAAAPAAPAATPAALAMPAAELGKPAPDFTLTDSEGQSHHLADLRGKVVVLEWFNPDCPFSKAAHVQGQLKETARQVMRDDRVWFSINSNAAGKEGNGLERNKRAKGEYAIPNAILLDETGVVGHAYGALKTPHLFIIDKNGVLAYRGGIDNAPMNEVDPARPHLPGAADGALINYVKAALEDLDAGKPVRMPETPAYGCTVKYAS